LIFRVFGYSHPSNGYICDAEYAPASIFKSSNPKALRNHKQELFYKFYEDEGWKLIQKEFSQYRFFHEMLQTRVTYVGTGNIAKTRKPERKLRSLIEAEPTDNLVSALQDVLRFVAQRSTLAPSSFGVFGSVLHGFHNSRFSDIDFITYGRQNVAKLTETLRELYADSSSHLQNEFHDEEPIKSGPWRFQNYTTKEYQSHQRRKMIYGLFTDQRTGRTIKTEFEPVKDWSEIKNEYDSETRIIQKGWVKMTASVSDDKDAPFIPSVYVIEPLHVLNGTHRGIEVVRIVSYMEEFRLQAVTDEKVYVEGNLEEVVTPKKSYHQITLTYCPRYYEQVLKTAHPVGS